MTVRNYLQSKQLDQILARCDSAQLVEVVSEPAQNGPSYIILP